MIKMEKKCDLSFYLPLEGKKKNQAILIILLIKCKWKACNVHGGWFV